MKALPILALVLVVSVVVYSIYASTLGADRDSSPAPLGAQPVDTADTTDTERVAQLERLVEELRTEIERLGMQVALLEDGRRTPLVQGPVGAERMEPRTASDFEETDPRWYLDQYVASFRGGGEGSEYFRLAVDAFLPSLVEPVLALVGNPSANETLRLRLVEMIGDTRFRQEARVIKALVDRVAAARDDALILAALHGLMIVADSRTAPALERVVWRMQTRAVRLACIQCILSLAGAEANRAIANMIRTAPNENAIALLISLVDQADLIAALDIFRFVSHQERDARLAGAQRIGAFQSDDFIDFVAEWIGREPDEAVRRALGAASDQQKQIPAYHPRQMTGAPNVRSVTRDHPHAWASQEPDGGPEWVEVTYDPPFKAHTVRIFETHVAGAVKRVFVIDTAGKRYEVFAGTDPTESPGPFDVSFTATGFPVAAVRIELDTTRGTSWNEIDAVELVGTGRRAWASDARASSYYGQHRSSAPIRWSRTNR